MTATAELHHSLLERAGVPHGFGVRGARERAGLARVEQVHGAEVAETTRAGWARPREADALVSTHAGTAIGIATADCVPILACTATGREVAAIHAGWRGLAAGVVEAGISALASHDPQSHVVAVVGPHIGPCCYEVDEPVIAALRARFDDDLPDALRHTRPGHALLDLGLLARRALARARIRAPELGRFPDTCTRCDAQRFHSYRRDGPRSGRLVHWVEPAPRHQG